MESIRKWHASQFRELGMSTKDGVGNENLKVDWKQRKGWGGGSRGKGSRKGREGYAE